MAKSAYFPQLLLNATFGYRSTETPAPDQSRNIWWLGPFSFGASMLALALAPNQPVAFAVGVVMGFTSISFMTASTAIVQLRAGIPMLIDALESGKAEWAPPPIPSTMKEVLDAYEAQLEELLAQVADCTTRGHRIRIKVGHGFVERQGRDRFGRTLAVDRVDLQVQAGSVLAPTIGSDGSTA